MKKSLYVILFLTILIALFSLYPNSVKAKLVKNVDAIYSGATPVFVFIERNPWLFLMGSDTPSFVLYDNGQIVFKRLYQNSLVGYFQIQLSPQELAEFKEKIIKKEVFQLNQSYSVSESFDEVDNIFYFSDDSNKKILSVYGRLDSNSVSGLPDALKNIYKIIKDFNPDNSHIWKPQHIEVVFQEGLLSKLPKIWKEFPIYKRKSAYSIYLPFEKISDAIKLANENSGATDSGHIIYGIRYVFPNEPVWVQAEQKLQREK